SAVQRGLNAKKKQNIAAELDVLVGQVSLDTYVDRVRAALGALPQEIRIIAQGQSKPEVFENIAKATAFLQNPKFDFSEPTENYVYEITYTDGTEFERVLATVDEVKALHQEIERLATH